MGQFKHETLEKANIDTTDRRKGINMDHISYFAVSYVILAPLTIH